MEHWTWQSTFLFAWCQIVRSRPTTSKQVICLSIAFLDLNCRVEQAIGWIWFFTRNPIQSFHSFTRTIYNVSVDHFSWVRLSLKVKNLGPSFFSSSAYSSSLTIYGFNLSWLHPSLIFDSLRNLGAVSVSGGWLKNIHNSSPTEEELI